MKAAMKSRDSVKLNTIRQLRAQLKDAQIKKQAELSEDEVMATLTTAAKRRNEAIALYKKGGRDELVAAEEAERAIIQAYLPQQLTRDELHAIVKETITETGAQSAAEFGKVMGKIMAKVRGRADGKMVQELLRSELN